MGGLFGGAGGALGGYLKSNSFARYVGNNDRYLADCPKCAAMFPDEAGTWFDEVVVTPTSYIDHLASGAVKPNYFFEDLFVGGKAFELGGIFLSTIKNLAKPMSANPFKGKTFVELDKMFRAKGFTTKGPDPLMGKGSYINPKSGTKYYLDRGAQYSKGYEGPHVDVWYNGHQTLDKVKYFLDGSPKMYSPLKK